MENVSQKPNAVLKMRCSRHKKKIISRKRKLVQLKYMGRKTNVRDGWLATEPISEKYGVLAGLERSDTGLEAGRYITGERHHGH